MTAITNFISYYNGVEIQEGERLLDENKIYLSYAKNMKIRMTKPMKQINRVDW